MKCPNKQTKNKYEQPKQLSTKQNKENNPKLGILDHMISKYITKSQSSNLHGVDTKAIY